MTTRITNRRAEAIDELFILDDRRWHGETLCVKKYPTGDEEARFMGCSAFGVITSSREPVTVWLRGENPLDDFKRQVHYDTHDQMMDDGWVVD